MGLGEAKKVGQVKEELTSPDSVSFIKIVFSCCTSVFSLTPCRVEPDKLKGALKLWHLAKCLMAYQDGVP